jgi:outer membrane protein assembly factor BamB
MRARRRMDRLSPQHGRPEPGLRRRGEQGDVSEAASVRSVTRLSLSNWRLSRMLLATLLLGALIWVAAMGSGGQHPPRISVPPERATSIVLDASDFLDEIPARHTITSARSLGVPWLFNNTALEMRTRSNYVTRVEIPEPGTYHLYVRSQGSDESTFRVAVGERVIDEDLGNEPLRLRKAGRFELEAGPVDVRLMRIEHIPVFDVLVLTRSDQLTEEQLKAFELPEDVAILKDYEIPPASAVKFGDLTGDGRMDFLVLTRDYSATAFDHDGRELWSYQAPEAYREARASFEAPGLIWDFDRDGRADVVHWRMEDEEEWLAITDGRTGEVKHRTAWPTAPQPHDYSNFRLAIGNLNGSYPSEILVLTDSGVYANRQPHINVAAYDASLDLLWQHHETRLKDHLGHYVYPVDLTGDGRDEVVVSTLVLDASGRELWNRFDLAYMNHDHADSYRFADIIGDGRRELVSAHSDMGIMVMDAATGRVIWQNAAEHAQQLEVGEFLDGARAPQVVVGARTYGNRDAGEAYLWSQVHWFDADGELTMKWPGNPINGNPVFVRGDWDGSGSDALFWYKFRLMPNGKGRLYFGEPVYHMFDFVGNGVDDVITLEGPLLRVYGHATAHTRRSPLTSDTEYVKTKVANHTHY